MRREKPQSVEQILDSYIQEFQKLQNVVGEEFGVDLNTRNFIRGGRSADLEKPISVWVFLFLNDWSMRNRDAAWHIGCSVAKINHYY